MESLEKRLISVEKDLNTFQSRVGVNSALFFAMRDFFLKHTFRYSRIVDNDSRYGVVSSWKEDSKIPLVLASYLIHDTGEKQLYIEAFFQVHAPNYNTVLSFDRNGDVRFDAAEGILGDSPNHYHPILIPDKSISFLRHVPKLQKELKDLIETYKEFIPSQPV